ncbi:MAG: ABC-2 transporter permease [Tissierellia bacterium]|nr:ABC-2 transporter permease [Tissierellia bacterium]
MFKLIRKDLLLALSNKFYLISTLLFAPLLLFFMDFQVNEKIIVIIIYGMSFFLLSLSFYYVDKLKPEVLIQSLPIRKREIVLSKYMLVFLCYLIGVIYVSILFKVAEFLGYSITANLNISIIKITLPLVIIHQSIILPISFGISDRLANSIGTGLLVFINNFYLMHDFERTSRMLLNSSNRFSVALIVILIFVLSIIVSITIYKNKDLP